MKKGFEAAGMSSSSSSSNSVQPSDKVATSPPSIVDQFKKVFAAEPLTEAELIAERIRDGEGVLWSAGYGRAWRSKKGMPQDEITVEEAKRLSEELSIPIPAEVDAA